MSKEVPQYFDKIPDLWAEQPQQNVLQYSYYLMRQFTADSQIASFVSGMLRMAIVSGYLFINR